MLSRKPQPGATLGSAATPLPCFMACHGSRGSVSKLRSVQGTDAALRTGTEKPGSCLLQKDGERMRLRWKKIGSRVHKNTKKYMVRVTKSGAERNPSIKDT